MTVREGRHSGARSWQEHFLACVTTAACPGQFFLHPIDEPKLDNAHMEGDDVPCEQAALFRTAACTLLYVSKRQPEIKSTVPWLCKRLNIPTKDWRRLVKLERYRRAAGSWRHSSQPMAKSRTSQANWTATGLAMTRTAKASRAA